MTLLNKGSLFFLKIVAKRYAIQEIEFDLPDPALCWIK